MVSGAEIGFAGDAALAAGGALAFGKGAIVGALLVGAAYLAGIAVLKRSAAAFCGFLFLGAASALQSVWLGVVPAPAPTILMLLVGVFAAASLIFVSATIGIVARNQILGGLLFAGALSLVGIGVINAILGGEASGLLRLSLAAVGATAIALSAVSAVRGDAAARFVLPGAALAASAPLLIGLAGGGLAAIIPQAVFAIGVLLASIVAISQFPAAAPVAPAPDQRAAFSADDGVERYRAEQARADALKVSENQLAQVLDYAGVAVWDWSRSGSHQTSSFSALMGAEGEGAFTPESFRAFVRDAETARLDQKIFGAEEGDGGFDETFTLRSGVSVRMRGARAVDSSGALERIVVFLEDRASIAPPTKQKEEALNRAASALTTPAASALLHEEPRKEPVSDDGAEPGARMDAKAEAVADEVMQAKEPAHPAKTVSTALESGEIVAAFQPIVCFDTGNVCGAEALVRWPEGGVDGKALSTEDIVRDAQSAGKGRTLASTMLCATADYVAERIAKGEKGFFGAFNVSLSQVKEEGFAEEVRAAMADRGLPHGSLVLELTEGEQLADTPKIHETFRKLKAAGAALAYDDFGAGFSSLSNLHRYDFDFLKIDKSFIDDIVANGGKKKIAAALARLGREFGMTVIAEGVESQGSADIAKSIGCRMGQGYHLGAPAFPEAKVTIVVDNEGTEAQAASKAAAAAAPQSDTDTLVLDRRLEAPKSAGSVFGRRRWLKASR